MNTALRALVKLQNRSRALHISRKSLQCLESSCPHVQFEYLEDPDVLSEHVARAHFVLCWEFRADWYALAPHLRAVFTPAAGRDWVEDDPAAKVHVHHGAFHGNMIAESMLAMMLHFNDRRDTMRLLQAAHTWGRDAQMPRRLLANQRVLLVGYGTIARHCARLLRAIGTHVVGLKRAPSSDHDPVTGATIRPFSELPAELAQADHVALLLPGTPETRAIIGQSALSSMKPSAYLYNFGRGTVVDQQALISVLRNRQIAGAGLDVFESEPLDVTSELWEMPNVLITPHSSCHFEEYGQLFAAEALPMLKAMSGKRAD